VIFGGKFATHSIIGRAGAKVATTFLYDANGLPVGSSAGALNVNIVSGGGSGGTASNFAAAFPGTGTAAGAKTPGGNMAALNLDGSGNLLIAGSLSVGSVTSNTASAAAQTAVGTTAGQVLAANAGRKRVMLQNAGTTVIKIVLGAGTPTQSAYHLALPACGSANDGSNPPYQDIMWTGAIQAISSAAGGLLQVTELT
jgi:hypothetical protein